jgi:hypothetical protein
MNRLKSLEIKKLFKELDFLETDYIWTSEVVNEADTSFMESINSFLDKHPDLKNLYDTKITNKVNESIENIREIENIENIENIEVKMEEKSEEIDEVRTEDKSPKVKKIYRDIVKITHPDIVGKESKLNELYIEATKYYDTDDLIGLYKVCSELDIPYNIEDDDQNHITIKIQEYKSKINFLESTYTWKWVNTKDDVERNRILVSFIKMKLGS